MGSVFKSIFDGVLNTQCVLFPVDCFPTLFIGFKENPPPLRPIPSTGTLPHDGKLNSIFRQLKKEKQYSTPPTGNEGPLE